jgi:type I restriction enzyme, S subunit
MVEKSTWQHTHRPTSWSARLAQAHKQVDKLTPSLLARAFAGRLVPQNPADEPAETLLERIKAKR